MAHLPRAGIYLIESARAHAFLRGRGYVIPDDVKELALMFCATASSSPTRQKPRTLPATILSSRFWRALRCPSECRDAFSPLKLKPGSDFDQPDPGASEIAPAP